MDPSPSLLLSLLLSPSLSLPDVILLSASAGNVEFTIVSVVSLFLGWLVGWLIDY